jgi:Bacterial Ig-like domain (group 3)/Beta-propeller repeat
MRRTYFACLFLCLTTTFLLSQSNPVPLINQSAIVVPQISVSQADPKAQARILDSYGKLPLSFEANQGQTDARVKFLSRTSGYSLFLTGNEAVLTLSGSKADTNKAKIAGTAHTLQSGMAAPKSGVVLRMKLRDANPAAKVTGVDELVGTSNYFIGNDPAKWRTGVPTYAKVKYEGIYSGIDLVYYGNQRQLEYDFIVAPGADPHRIAFDVRGAKRINRDKNEDLSLQMTEGEIRWHRPVVYQEKDGARQLVAARYVISDTNRVGFQVARYDASRPLYIDPLIYSTYLGGSGYDAGQAIAVDSSGNAYVTGFTNSTDFPTKNPLQAANGGEGDAFVAKINPTGSALVYSTYLGGSGSDGGAGIAVDSAGNLYVIGTTYSTDFPTTSGAFQTACGDAGCLNGDGFVTKIDAAGSALVYSTYLGGSGSDYGGAGIAVDSASNAYVIGTTYSTDFPTTSGAFQTACGDAGCLYGDAFVAKINPAGSALVYSTYLGGSRSEYGMGIAVDSAGNAYVTGITYSTDFPTKNPLQAANGGELDAFVAKINPTGSALVYSTYLGGSGFDGGTGIAVDSAGHVYVTGGTGSADFPTKNPLQAANGGAEDAFVAKINVAGSSLVYSTYLGGSGQDDYLAGGIAVDSAGNAYVTGNTGSTDFPTTPGAFKTTCGRCANYEDAFVAKIDPTGSVLVYSTYLGGSGYDTGVGIAVDSSRNAYVTGYTTSTNFPTKNPLQLANAGGYDAFVAKMDVRATTTISLTSLLNPSIYGQAVTFTAVVTSTIGAPPNGETVTFKNGTTVLGTGTLSGGSASYTTSTLTGGTHGITAVYGGDANFAGSTSKVVKQVVNKATTTTTLTSSLNPSNFGQSVTFTASVAPEYSGTVKGTVTFYDGTTALKTVFLSGGVAKYTTSTLSSGSHTITGTYNGSTNFTGSSGSLTQQVN